MDKQDKELLLKDLCARLPYGVKVDVNFYDATKELSCDLLKDFIIDEKSIRPYLRSMSSMTKEEEKEYKKVIETLLWTEEFDFYNKYHFDYRGLIPMGLALEAPEGMYNF